jgi:ribonuclease HI
MKRIQKNGIEIKIHWTPGHANVNGNEIADRLAKEAAKEAEHFLLLLHICHNEEYNVLRFPFHHIDSLHFL